ncbi:hypothetical protein [Saccharothrix xinjiangensis]|uniref:Uncharacterized protein n=1 Tax=Saccharothrix xinjiangensis TaxID=204798 RepID=A0ABV9YAC3_9PSEU
MDWHGRHDDYDHPGSSLALRLEEERGFERRWPSPPDAGFGVGALVGLC